MGFGGAGQQLNTLHIMVGLPGSGKTTLARALAAQTGAIRFTPDDWHLLLFGQDLDDPAHNARHDQIEAIQQALAFDLLARGVDVVLDFGVWSRAERDDLRARARALGVTVVLHPCDAPLDQLVARSQSRPDGFPVTLAMLTTWSALYDPVTPEEAAL